MAGQVYARRLGCSRHSGRPPPRPHRGPHPPALRPPPPPPPPPPRSSRKDWELRECVLSTLRLLLEACAVTPAGMSPFEGDTDSLEDVVCLFHAYLQRVRGAWRGAAAPLGAVPVQPARRRCVWHAMPSCRRKRRRSRPAGGQANGARCACRQGPAPAPSLGPSCLRTLPAHAACARCLRRWWRRAWRRGMRRGWTTAWRRSFRACGTA